MLIKWRNQDLEPVRLTDSSFYLSNMNEKLIFVSKPKMHIELAPKEHTRAKNSYFQNLKMVKKYPTNILRTKPMKKL